MNCITNNDDLYIVAYVDENDNVTGFPKGGGKAHDNLTSAKRSKRFFPRTKIVKVKDFEIIED